MVHYCSVPQCRGKWGCTSNLRFHGFPKNEEMCKLWQKAIGCLTPPSHSMKVCSKHFKVDDYQTVLPGCKRLKKCAVPCLFLPSKIDAFSQTSCNDYTFLVSSITQIHSPVEVRSESCRQLTHISEPPPFSHQLCLSTEDSNWEEMKVKTELDFSPSMHFRRNDHFDMLNDFELRYLSGISRPCFRNLFVMLTGESLTLPPCNMTAQEQLFLTLSKLKHNFAYPLLSIFFKIEQSDAVAVFSFWTYHIFKTLKLYFGVALKAEKRETHSVTVGVVKVPVIESHTHQHTNSAKIKSLKSLVVVNDDNQSVLLCSGLYDELTSNDFILHEMEFQQCVGPNTLVSVHRTMSGSKFFSEKYICVSLCDSVKQCLCNQSGESIMCIFSSFLLTKCFQCLTEVFKILSDGLPSSISTMSSEIFFNCMMLFNFAK